jgi:peptide subunit release factor 1 (eRF1)
MMERGQAVWVASVVRSVSGVKSEQATLVTLYVPAGTPLERVATLLRGELPAPPSALGAVEARLTTAWGRLTKAYPSGFAVFAGLAGSGHEWVFEVVPLPEPVEEPIVMVGNRFYVEPLVEMLWKCGHHVRAALGVKGRLTRRRPKV